MDDDRELVANALARRPGAFESLVARHQKLVWHLVYRAVQHPEDARELSQEVFMRVYQRLHQFRFESALSTWIGRIAFSVSTRHLQRKRLPMVVANEDDEDEGSALENIGDDFDLETACADADLMARVGEALESLSPVQRVVVTLYHLDELGIPEISRITDMPQGTIKNHLFRARLKLRQRLESEMGVAA